MYLDVFVIILFILILVIIIKSKHIFLYKANILIPISNNSVRFLGGAAGAILKERMVFSESKLF